MKIEFNEAQKSIFVKNKDGKEIVISCVHDSYDNTQSKFNGDFDVANNVLQELGKIINEAKQSI